MSAKRIPVPTFLCPSCGATIYAVTNLLDDTPLPGDGDLGVCATCLAMHLYENTPFGLLARQLRADENWIRTDPKVIEAIARMRGQREQPND